MRSGGAKTKGMTYKGIKVSTNWDCIKSFQWMCENAKFIFSHKSYKGERIKIVVNEPIEKFDCFEIGYDRYGVTTNADTVFSSGWGEMIEDSSKEIVEYIKEYLKREGVSDLIEHDPHEVSSVKCDLCGKEWVAVRPLGLIKLECPNCKNMVQFENV